MKNALSLIKEQILDDQEIIALAIIENENQVVLKGDWQIDEDIEVVNSIWNVPEARTLTIKNKQYIIIQNTLERLIAVSFKKRKNKVLSKEYLIGIRDNKGIVLGRVPENIQLKLAVPKIASILKNLSFKDSLFNRSEIKTTREKIRDLTPKILSKSSRIFEKLGLNSIGLSEADAKVYLALLRKGIEGEKVGALNKELDLKRTHIYRIIDRLIEKGLVEKLINLPESAQFYSAKPIQGIIDNVIKDKEDELKILKGLRLIVSESPENGWHLVSELNSELKSQFDIDIYEIIGFEKDSGIVIFEYDRIIRDEENLDRVKLRLYSEKLKKDIEKHPDVETIIIAENKINHYLGAELSITFKENSKTAKNLGVNSIKIFKLVTIPVDNKIYLIWGSKEKFQLLYDLIIKIG